MHDLDRAPASSSPQANPPRARGPVKPLYVVEEGKGFVVVTDEWEVANAEAE